MLRSERSAGRLIRCVARARPRRQRQLQHHRVRRVCPPVEREPERLRLLGRCVLREVELARGDLLDLRLGCAEHGLDGQHGHLVPLVRVARGLARLVRVQRRLEGELLHAKRDAATRRLHLVREVGRLGRHHLGPSAALDDETCHRPVGRKAALDAQVRDLKREAHPHTPKNAHGSGRGGAPARQRPREPANEMPGTKGLGFESGASITKATLKCSLTSVASQSLTVALAVNAARGSCATPCSTRLFSFFVVQARKWKADSCDGRCGDSAAGRRAGTSSPAHCSHGAGSGPSELGMLGLHTG